jgi:hypothetical protein
MRTAKDGFRGTKDETVKLGETDTGGQVSVTQVGPKNFNGTKFQRRNRWKRSRVKWKKENNPKYSDQSVISISNNSSHFKKIYVGFWTILSIRFLYINLAFLLDTIFFTKVSVVSCVSK